jgi:DNA-binding transcriptional LysR family regulator
MCGSLQTALTRHNLLPAKLPYKGAFLRINSAKMQTMNWNDLRYVLALSRAKSLAAAARMLGVDDTTVARRLAAAEATLGVRLFQRLGDGALELTPSGERTALHAERIEREISALDGVLSGAKAAVSGTVRVTSVPIIVNRVLIPAAGALLRQHPQLMLEFIGDARALSLTRREADLALRLARPKTGGTKVTARRIGTLRYAVYASASYPVVAANKLPWLSYDEAMAHLPPARWIAATATHNDEKIAPLRVDDAEPLLEAVAAGLGRSLLPCAVAERDKRLRKLGAKRASAPPARELWLLAHSDLRKLSRIEAVIAWLERIAPR